MAPQQTTPLDGRIKIRHLACFLEVSRLKSAVKAAAALGLSQPAVSKTIHELEHTLGVALFEPKRRSMILTGAGEVFLRYAGSSVTALKQGVRMVGGGGASAEVVCAVGALPTVSARILPDAVARITRELRGIRLRIITGATEVLLAQLRFGDLDLVVGRLAAPEAMKGLAFEHLYSERIALVVRPDHPLLQQKEFRVADIGAYQMLLPPSGSIIHPTVERYLVTHSIQPTRGEIETVSDAFARSYLLRTDAIWLISEGVISEDVKKGLLSTLPADTGDTPGPVGLTTRTDTELPLPARLLVQALRDIVASASLLTPVRGEQYSPNAAGYAEVCGGQAG